MKVKICFNLMLVFAIIFFVSCEKDNEPTGNNDLVLFEFHRFGGWFGLNETLRIDADFTHYSISYANRGESFHTTVKTSAEQWNSLTRDFDLETFRKIENGSCRACRDGFDEKFSLIQSNTIYFIYNADDDKHFKQMQNFFDAIFKQAEDLKSMANFENQ